jgi:hypothetical protein
MPKTSGAESVASQTAAPSSELAGAIQWFEADRGSLSRFYTVRVSRNRSKRLLELYSESRKGLDSVNFEALSHDGKVDWLLFKNHLDKESRDLVTEAKRVAEAEPLLPVIREIVELEESRRLMGPLDPVKAARTIDSLKKKLEKNRADLEKKAEAAKADPAKMPAPRTVANRAAGYCDQLKETLADWYRFYNGYVPLFDWWCDEPYKALDKALGEYSTFLKEKIVGIKADDKKTIIGDPIGNDALQIELESELIPYTPEELVKIAEKEFAWCDAEMLKASREMGFKDDWKLAVEKIKGMHVGPGEQPKLVRELALEAIEFLEKRDLVTIPQLAKETWRMEMMSAERQLQNPFFLGGEQITVSFPTDTMTQEQKLMSLRANNIPMSRATDQHELIPGHHLQQFMLARYSQHRRTFSTPFWTEGWALYWEMLLWDLGFPRTPEEKVGMLVWRLHRCARIIFSLNFHMGKWQPDECVKFLIERVGFEPDAAAAEVRRSFMGNYGPLYQAAYMLGGLQFRELHKELVGGNFGAPKRKMSNRDFHDAILKSGNMPVAMVRAVLTKPQLARDYDPMWRFYEVDRKGGARR